MSASSAIGLLALFAQVQASTPTAEAVAQGLFEQGVTLMEEGRFDEACPKLVESQRLDPGGGTLLNLASCFERQNKWASAYATYNDALSWAIRDGRKEREDKARERLAALQPSLSHVIVQIPEPVVGLEVSLDDVVIGTAAWGVPLPVDPGEHAISAKAPGRVSFATRATWGATAETQTFRIPRLGLIVREEPPKPAPVRTSRAGIALGVLGLGLLATGGVTGVLAFGARSDSDAACPTPTRCTPEGVRAMDRAETLAWTSNVTLGLGLVSAAISVYLLFIDRPAARPASGALSF